MIGLSPDRWHHADRLFAEALGRPPDERTAWLRAACAAPDGALDETLYRALRALLDSDTQAPRDLGDSAALWAAPLLADDAAEEALAPGRTVGTYRLLEPLGRGGMGVVYRAHDPALDRTVALKFLAPCLASNERARARFVQEARAASALDHPHICTIYEIGEADDGEGPPRPYIAMACYDGETLKERLTRGPLPVGDAVATARQIASALARAHEHGVVHRDVKPANVMLTRHGAVKLLDFGIAQRAADPAEAAVGTVAYMSPEQTRGEAVGPAADLWALGAVLYEMLAGEPPFPAGDVRAALDAIRTAAPPPLKDQRPEVPDALDGLVARLLRKDPAERPPDAEAAIAALDRAAAAGRRPAWRPVPVALAFLAVAALVATGLWGRRAPAPEALPRLAVLPFEDLRGGADTGYLGVALADQITSRVSYLPNLVTRPASAVRAAPTAADPAAAAADLGVDWLLTGSYLREGDSLRVHAELVDVAGNAARWRATVAVAAADVFRVQDLVAERVARGLEDEVAAMRALEVHGAPPDPRAYEAYLRSLAFPTTPEGNRRAVALLEEATARDPAFAPAFAELGWRRYYLASFGLGGEAAVAEAERALGTALRLDPNGLDALGHLAILYTETGRIEQSLALSRRALAINPNHPYVHLARGHALRYAGLLDASREAYETALALDPGNRQLRGAGVTSFCLGDYERAAALFDLDAGSSYALAWQGAILLKRGRPEQAVAHFDQIIRREGSSQPGLLAVALKAAATGEHAAGVEALRRIEAAAPVDVEAWYFIGADYALLGARDDALRALTRAVEGGYYNAPYLRTDSFLDALHGDPRLDRLLAHAEAERAALRRLLP